MCRYQTHYVLRFCPYRLFSGSNYFLAVDRSQDDPLPHILLKICTHWKFLGRSFFSFISYPEVCDQSRLTQLYGVSLSICFIVKLQCSSQTRLYKQDRNVNNASSVDVSSTFVFSQNLIKNFSTFVKIINTCFQISDRNSKT